QSHNEKERSYTDNSQHRNRHEPEQLIETGSIQKEPRARRIVVRKEDEQHTGDGHRHKQHDRSQQTRQVLARDQHFTPHRREKVVMQTAIDDLTAEKIHENPGTAEENDRAQNQRVVIDRKNSKQLIACTSERIDRLNQHQQSDWHQRQQVNQQRTLAKEILLQLKPQDRRELSH